VNIVPLSPVIVTSSICAQELRRTVHSMKGSSVSYCAGVLISSYHSQSNLRRDISRLTSYFSCQWSFNLQRRCAPYGCAFVMCAQRVTLYPAVRRPWLVMPVGW
jgi:hypothetical protein